MMIFEIFVYLLKYEDLPRELNIRYQDIDLTKRYLEEIDPRDIIFLAFFTREILILGIYFPPRGKHVLVF